MNAGYTQLTVGIERDGDGLKVSVAGDLDHDSAPSLRVKLDAAVTDEICKIELDLAHVTFIDSAALQVFVSMHDEMSGRGGGLIITDTSPLVARILKVTRLGDLFGQ